MRTRITPNTDTFNAVFVANAFVGNVNFFIHLHVNLKFYQEIIKNLNKLASFWEKQKIGWRERLVLRLP